MFLSSCVLSGHVRSLAVLSELLAVGDYFCPNIAVRRCPAPQAPRRAARRGQPVQISKVELSGGLRLDDRISLWAAQRGLDGLESHIMDVLAHWSRQLDDVRARVAI